MYNYCFINGTARSLGVPVGELVSTGKMGALGEISASKSDDFYSEDDNDPKKPVRQFMHVKGFKFADSDFYSWRRIKHDFLRPLHMPRCDFLVWILVVKLAPTYYRKLNRLLTETGQYRELPSWRKGLFQRE